MEAMPSGQAYAALTDRPDIYRISLLTLREWRPLALLAASTFLPFFVAMRALKPCLFLLFLLWG
jgi:hypothetical protein